MGHRTYERINKNQPGQRESKRVKIENDSDDAWVWDFDVEKVIIAYHTVENRKSGLDKSLKEKGVFVPPPEQLKEIKVRRDVYHKDMRQAEAKEEILSHHLSN